MDFIRAGCSLSPAGPEIVQTWLGIVAISLLQLKYNQEAEQSVGWRSNLEKAA